MSRKLKKQRHHPSSQRANKPISLAKARSLTEKYPEKAHCWHALGSALFNNGNWQEAKEALERAKRIDPDNAAILEGLARATNKCGDSDTAVRLFEASLALDNHNPQAHFTYSNVLFDRSQYPKALTHIEEALVLMPENLDMLSHYGLILYKIHRYSDSIKVFDTLIKRQPEHYSHWNNAANLRRDLGLLDEAEFYYKESIKRTIDNARPYSNRLTALHYNPHVSRDAIFDVCREWEQHYAPSLASLTPLVKSEPDKVIRVGMISDGFRQHPVGKMINRVLEAIPEHSIELIAYSTNSAVDPLTVHIRRAVSRWMSVTHMTDEQLGQQIIDDRIDILMDLCGHNAGSRMRTMAMKPAPVQVKWVGGLINTTGLSTMDYLLSDSVETPEDVDPFYVEKLIRLPDDYICYDPGNDRPLPQGLPAKKNGYITLGCFNNPTKINEELLAEWALIMHELPESRLFLKGFQFNSLDLCQRVRTFMEAQDVATERLIIEGPSPHLGLMEAYRRVDIALDPWPYSGGLTTCEALMMGVPVVTLPGPTFAGRHSATHLVNAGMPELVVNSWKEYRERVLELASDIESLATIRTHLRDVLLQSPVCDAPRFAKHFTIAMRAIWQRYCEGKEPEALTFNKEGAAQFADEDAPVVIHYIPKAKQEKETGFSWQFNGKIVVIDNSSKLVNQGNIQMLRQFNAFGIVAFDPASRVQNPAEFEGSEDVQVFPHVVLGNGEPSTLYVCLDPAFSSTLKPLPPEQQHGVNTQSTKVLTELPINTIALDSIEGLESLDWLILDDLADASAILENGEQALKEALLIQVRIAFQLTHERQPNLAEVQHWMARHGFRFYRFNDQQHLSHLPESVLAEKRQATELQSTDAIFLPSHERMAELNDNQRTKLAFLLHTVYGIKDMTYELLAEVDEEKSKLYLIEENLLSNKEVKENPHEKHISVSKDENNIIYDNIIFVVGCGHSGTTLMASLLGAHPAIYTIERETYWFLNRPYVDKEYTLEKDKCLALGKEIICEKTPRHVYKIQEMKEKFPNAKFIAMARESKDNVASLKKRAGDFEGALKRWEDDNEKVSELSQEDFFHLVRYEDLVANKEETMKTVFYFLNLEYDSSVFEFYKNGYQWSGVKDAEETDGGSEESHLKRRSWQMTQPIHDNRGKWKEILTDREAEVVDKKTYKLKEKLGYTSAIDLNNSDRTDVEGYKKSGKSVYSKDRLSSLWELDNSISVVDIGANPIDGIPPYAELLSQGLVNLVGFEPQRDALQKLVAMKGPNETYLPHAVGTGERTNLYICQASGMTSTLKPNNQVLNHFQGYPIWGKVKSVEEIDTVRLDDVSEIDKIDWLKIDIQGGELNVFKNGEEKLKDALVIQTEVNFIQLYENQPLFAEIDQWMRNHGFMLHTLLEQRKRLFAPMKINGGIHQGINQLTTADALYVKDINLSHLSTEQRKKIAFILSKAYGSYDLAYRLLMKEKDFNKKDFFKKIVGKQINAISID